MTFIPTIIAWLVRKGVSPRLAMPLVAIVAFIALAAALWGAVALHDRRVIKASDQQHEAKLAPVIAKAGDNAAAQRSTDAIAISKTEQEAHAAIAKAPETAPSPAAIALGCARLRRARKDASGLPPACRPPSGH